jgi:hypothetical protein
MGKKIAQKDWSATPLGPLEQWAQPLRTAVTLALENLFPTVIYWGPDLPVIYNDAYRPLLGDKPEALGRPLREVWSEAWEILQPTVEKTFAGKASYFENAPFTLLRHGYPEQTWFDYCFSPLRDDSGSVVGILNTAVERTSKKKIEQELERDLRESEMRHRRFYESGLEPIRKPLLLYK